MRIQRSTYDFLLISAVLGSIVLATAYLGYGAGVLVLLFWLVFILIKLKRAKPAAEDGSPHHAKPDPQDAP
ncbi:hypothetical protein [Halothiobacillus sp. DCM-1]|uniref:hypothetical protein n=1 Tax=Halothiobacillus sp. DCM-1 TaxID=3112558 RepID=UPI0032560F5A